MSHMLAGLSKESQTLVRIINVIIMKLFKTELESKMKLWRKTLRSPTWKLKWKAFKVKLTASKHIDNIDQYERTDTVVVSGPSLPPETAQENTKNLIVATFKDHLKINIRHEDMSLAHRLGAAHQNRNRPVIVKLVNRSLKHNLVEACISLKPELYINESLAPKRCNNFKQVLAVRKAHRHKFQQCHTKDGKIIIKLKNSTVRHTIVDEQFLLTFLDKYPEMMDSYQSSN